MFFILSRIRNDRKFYLIGERIQDSNIWVHVEYFIEISFSIDQLQLEVAFLILWTNQNNQI